MPLIKKIAIVHDWLTGMRGGEKVLEVLCEIFPQADLFTLFHIPGSVSPTIERHRIYTSCLSGLPFSKEKYRYYLPLMPMAVEQFNLSDYEIVISSSHCVAKGCKPKPGALHICYCYTPMRYIWDQYDNYFGKGQASAPVRMIMNMILSSLRAWDRDSSNRVQYFIADSKHVQKRIETYYQRDSEVIYPPVDTDFYTPVSQPSSSQNGYYLIVSAFAPYKKVDLAIEVFNQTNLPLKIIGKGQNEKKLKDFAKANIEFLGWKSNEEIKEYYQNCTALIFPGEEDFGIVPVEAMACGKPVIAFRKGGVTETVLENECGLFFEKQSVTSLKECLFASQSKRWDPEKIRKHALNFSRQRFKLELERSLSEKISECK